MWEWSIGNGGEKSSTAQQPEARVARESFTNRHLHIGNIDIDFITFLCYQHFLQYFQGGKMNKNWNPIEMIKYSLPVNCGIALGYLRLVLLSLIYVGVKMRMEINVT